MILVPMLGSLIVLDGSKLSRLSESSMDTRNGGRLGCCQYKTVLITYDWPFIFKWRLVAVLWLIKIQNPVRMCKLKASGASWVLTRHNINLFQNQWRNNQSAKAYKSPVGLTLQGISWMRVVASCSYVDLFYQNWWATRAGGNRLYQCHESSFTLWMAGEACERMVEGWGRIKTELESFSRMLGTSEHRVTRHKRKVPLGAALD